MIMITPTRYIDRYPGGLLFFIEPDIVSYMLARPTPSNLHHDELVERVHR
jgi:hypothetical protein